MSTVALEVKPNDALIIARRDPVYARDRGFYPILDPQHIITFQGNCKVRLEGERESYDFMRELGVTNLIYDNMSAGDKEKLRGLVSEKLSGEKDPPWAVEYDNPLLLSQTYSDSAGGLARPHFVSIYVDSPKTTMLTSDTSHGFLVIEQGLVRALHDYTQKVDSLIAHAREKARHRPRRR